MASIIEDLGRMIDKAYNLCLIVLLVIVLLFLLYIFSKIFGGSARG